MLPHSGSSLSSYYQKVVKSFHHHLRSTQDRMEIEDIHQLRVSIKQIRAVVGLVDYVTDHQFDKSPHLRLLKDLFGAAGRVREAQINLTLLENLNEPSLTPCIEYQRQHQTSASIALNRAIGQFPVAQLAYCDKRLLEELAQLPNDWMISKTVAFLFDEFDQVHWVLREGLTDKHLHKIRTKLKAVREVLTILAILDPNNTLLRLRTGMKRLARKIGDWHDQLVLCQMLRQFTYRSHPPKKLMDLIADLEKGNRKIRKRLEISLGKYLSNPVLMPQVMTA